MLHKNQVFKGCASAQLYLLLLFLRVLLSWFPAFNWERQPWLSLRQVQLLMGSAVRPHVQSPAVKTRFAVRRLPMQALSPKP